MESIPYSIAVGSLIFAMIGTWLDLAYYVSSVSSFRGIQGKSTGLV